MLWTRFEFFGFGVNVTISTISGKAPSVELHFAEHFDSLGVRKLRPTTCAGCLKWMFAGFMQLELRDNS